MNSSEIDGVAVLPDHPDLAVWSTIAVGCIENPNAGKIRLSCGFLCRSTPKGNRGHCKAKCGQTPSAQCGRNPQVHPHQERCDCIVIPYAPGGCHAFIAIRFVSSSIGFRIFSNSSCASAFEILSVPRYLLYLALSGYLTSHDRRQKGSISAASISIPRTEHDRRDTEMVERTKGLASPRNEYETDACPRRDTCGIEGGYPQIPFCLLTE